MAGEPREFPPPPGSDEVHIVLYAQARRMRLGGIYRNYAEAARVRVTLAGNGNEVYVYRAELVAHQNGHATEPDEVIHRKRP